MSTVPTPSSSESRKRKASPQPESPKSDEDDDDASYATGQEDEEETMTDEDILLVVDLMDSESINKYFPIQNGKGDEYNVPLHIRGFDVDYQNTFWKIRQYRMMSLQDQQLELRWGDTKNRMDGKEQQIYYSRIEAMVSTRNTLRITRRAAEDHIAAVSARKKKRPSQCTTIIPDDSDGSISVSPHVGVSGTTASVTSSRATPDGSLGAPSLNGVGAQQPDNAAVAAAVHRSTATMNSSSYWNHATTPNVKNLWNRLVNYPSAAAVRPHAVAATAYPTPSTAAAATALLAAAATVRSSTATALGQQSAPLSKSSLSSVACGSSNSIPVPAAVRSHPGTTTSNRGRHSSSTTATTRSIGPYSKAVHHGSGRSSTLPSSQVLSSSDEPHSLKKCIPLKPPIPAKFQGNMERMMDAVIPEFSNLVNFPAHLSRNKNSGNSSDGANMRCCMMCGKACPCSRSGVTEANSKNDGFAIIPTQNKGLCTLCDVNVWVIIKSGMQIKWCKGCKNFRPWAAFGDKGHGTKCVRCRERQREKYATQKAQKAKGCRIV